MNTNISDKELQTIGQYFDLDQTTKAYELGGSDVYWTDYTYDWYKELSESEQMKDENLDNAWDMDKYYADFDAWWLGLPMDEKRRIYNAL